MTNITLPRELVEQVLEALEKSLPYVQEQRGDMDAYNTELAADTAIIALQNALKGTT